MTLPRLAAAALAAALLPRPAPAAPAGAAGPLPRLDEASLVALAVALAVSPAPALEPPSGEDGPATVELAATVRLRQVTFAERPRIQVTLAGAGPARAWWKVERTHLPAEVEPGAVYRDVVLRLTLGGPPEQVEALLQDAARLAAGVRIEAIEPERPAPAALAAAPAAAAIVTPALTPAAPPAQPEAPAPAATAAADPSSLPGPAVPPTAETPAPAGELPAAVPPPAADAALPAPALATIAQARTADGEQVMRLLVGDGRIVERTLDARGVVVAERAAGDLAALPIRSQHRDAQGRVVQVLETGGADALEVLRDPMGRFLSARVLRGAGQLAPRG